jgi:hypothetical protein
VEAVEPGTKDNVSMSKDLDKPYQWGNAQSHLTEWEIDRLVVLKSKIARGLYADDTYGLPYEDPPEL